MSVEENIRRLRKQKKLTLKQLGNIVHLSEQAIGQYERGERTPNIKILQQIANALGVDINDLAENKENTKDVIFMNGAENKEKYNELIEKAYKEPVHIQPVKTKNMTVLGRLVTLNKDDKDLLMYINDVLKDFSAYIDVIHKQEVLATVGKYTMERKDYLCEVELLDRHRRMIHENIIRGIKTLDRLCSECNLPLFYGEDYDRVKVAEFVFEVVENSFRTRRL